MQALGFGVLMLGSLLLGLSILTVGIIAIIVFVILKSKKKVKKNYLISIPILLVIVGIIFLGIPTVWVSILRGVNSSTYEGYIDTGKMAYYENLPESSDTTFALGDERYVSFGYSDSEYMVKEEAYTNVCYKEVEHSFISEFFKYNNIGTVYKIKSDCGYNIYVLGNDLYCNEKDKEGVNKYYSDLNNYTFKYWVGNNWYEHRLSEMHSLELEQGIMKNLVEYIKKADSLNNKIEIIGNDFEEVDIKAVSSDGVNIIDTLLIKYKANLYCSFEEIYDRGITKIKCFPLTDELNKHFIEKLKG